MSPCNDRKACLRWTRLPLWDTRLRGLVSARGKQAAGVAAAGRVPWLAEMSAHNEAGRRPASPAPPPHTEQDEDDSHDQQALLHKSEDPSRAKQPSRTLDMLVTLTYCLVYLLVGPALILVNKKIMKVCSYTLSN